MHADRDIRIESGQAQGTGRYAMQWTDKGLLSRRNDISIEGSHIGGTQGVMIDAGRHLGIVEGRNTNSTRIDVDKKRSSPIFDPVFMQNRASGSGIDVRTDTAASSTITSSQGGVLLQGGGVVHLQGVQVAGARDIRIEGNEVSIAGAMNRSEVSGEQRRRGGDFGPLGLHDLG
ncbi:hypothetical protein, partial [Variovorax sp. JS1663]|uniref:hypothetical protein n=1 Tax=Variovorax sp. JS1663 TaxID=1851577 RepID=UPI001180E7D8